MSGDEFKSLMGPIRRPAGPRLVGDDDEFKIVMGRGGGRGGRGESFINEVRRAMQRPARRLAMEVAHGRAARRSGAAALRSAEAGCSPPTDASSSRLG